MPAEAIALLDCNNFYASCERAFDASLRGKPVVVLSNNDGCVVSRSEEAKQIGVSMGAPLFKIQGWLEEEGAEIFSSNYELYGDMSARVMENLKHFTPEIEIYSVDEAFLGLEQNGSHSFDYLGREIQEKIHKWTGVPVSLGIAETKVLAKLANRIAKKSQKANGVLDLYQSPHQRLALERTAVADVWGIGKASAAKLCENGIFTALDLREADLRWVKKVLRIFGARIMTELRGTRAFPLESNPPRHSMVCTRSFGKAITDYKTIREAVAVFTSRVAEKLRKHNLAAHSITTTVSTHRFNAYPEYYSNASTYSSAYPTDIDQELQAWAFGCLEKIFKQGFEYHKAGVMLGGLIPSDKLTERMYDDERWERFRRVMRAVDEINRRWGDNTIRFAAARPNGDWLSHSNRRSQRYTTRLNEIVKIAPL